MTWFKDKHLKNLVCRATLASTERKFNKYMTTIRRMNSEALQWLEAIPFHLWALSHEGGRRYRIMTTNISKVFNSVLKESRSLPVTALVQLTFFCLNSYFVAIRELSANRLASAKQFTPYVDAQIQGSVVKAGSMEIVLYDHVKGLFHVKSRRGRTHLLNLQEKKDTCGKTLIYGFPCSHIIAACQHRCVDFHFFVKATTLLKRTMIHGQAFSIQYSMKMSGLFMMVLQLDHLSQCNAWEMDVLNNLGCIMK